MNKCMPLGTKLQKIKEMTSCETIRQKIEISKSPKLKLNKTQTLNLNEKKNVSKIKGLGYLKHFVKRSQKRKTYPMINIKLFTIPTNHQ